MVTLKDVQKAGALKSLCMEADWFGTRGLEFPPSKVNVMAHIERLEGEVAMAMPSTLVLCNRCAKSYLTNESEACPYCQLQTAREALEKIANLTDRLGIVGGEHNDIARQALAALGEQP